MCVAWRVGAVRPLLIRCCFVLKTDFYPLMSAAAAAATTTTTKSTATGPVEYAPNESFILHVCWETPSQEAATKLLNALRACGAATHRDTPTVPTYFFRTSTNDAAGTGTGINTKASSVWCEFTEVYMDTAGFLGHAKSQDFLGGYAVIMGADLKLSADAKDRPITMRWGTPTDWVAQNILKPVLNEQIVPLVAGAAVYRAVSSSTGTATGSGGTSAAPVLLSIDVAGGGGDGKSSDVNLPSAFAAACSTLYSFPHPKRAGTTRIVAVLPSLPAAPLLTEFNAAVTSVKDRAVSRVEVWSGRSESGGDGVGDAKAAAAAAPEIVKAVEESVTAWKGKVTVNGGSAVGYILHRNVSEIKPAAAAAAGAAK